MTLSTLSTLIDLRADMSQRSKLYVEQLRALDDAIASLQGLPPPSISTTPLTALGLKQASDKFLQEVDASAALRSPLEPGFKYAADVVGGDTIYLRDGKTIVKVAGVDHEPHGIVISWIYAGKVLSMHYDPDAQICLATIETSL